MKYVLSLFCVIATLSSCRTRVESPRSMNPAAATRQKAIDEIREADQNFSIMSEKQGMAKAFTTYASDDVIKLNDGAAPTVGFDSLRAQMSRLPANGPVLTWQVLKADAAQSGELGYTFGQWMLTKRSEAGNRSATYGVYMTVWKRQRNGQWRFVLDGGNSTPEPK
ncbi:YybH family protein [Spirosoma aerophilum]